MLLTSVCSGENQGHFLLRHEREMKDIGGHMVFILQGGHFTVHSDLNVIALSIANLRDYGCDGQSVSLIGKREHGSRKRSRSIITQKLLFWAQMIKNCILSCCTPTWEERNSKDPTSTGL